MTSTELATTSVDLFGAARPRSGSTMAWIPGLGALLFFCGLLAPAAALAIAPAAAEQIAALVEEKRGRSPAQQKLASSLLFELAARRGDERLDGLPRFAVRPQADDFGRVLLDLDAVPDAELLGRIEALGGTVHSAFPRWRAVRATLPIDQLETLAGLAQVRSIRPADAYMRQMINTTEGVVAHGADTARVNFGVDGSGVQVGAMSDSVDALANLQASGDLPPGVTVLPGQSGNPGTSEGTALLEIIHDLAPGADLFFATGAGGQAQMAQNILDLQAAGCDVIVDDVLYFAEPVFQDGIIAQAVDAVAAEGVFYYSAAGNSGNLAAGTAGVWEGDYAGIALPGPLAGAGLSAHDFGGGVNSNEVTLDTPFFITLQWADPQDGADNDYDLYLLDPTLSNVLGASTNTQNGTQDPFEFLDSRVSDDLGNRLVVVQFSGADRFLHLNTHRGQLGLATDGQIFGHPAAAGALAVAAVNVASTGGGPFTGGEANPIEPFSSDGPRRIFFEADGSPVPAAFQRAPGVERQKPDLAAADGVMTATPGFDPFFGTSASAPHLAGIAALLKEFMSSLSAKGGEQRTKGGSLDIEDPGEDNVSGSGIPETNQVLEGKKGFQDDTFSAKTLLSNGTDCFDVHTQDVEDGIVSFDGRGELIDRNEDGTELLACEFQDDPDNLEPDQLQPFNVIFKINPAPLGPPRGPSGDLFPEGFEDPETGTPLTAACIEIGIDDTLDSDCPVDVEFAALEFFTSSGPFGPPIDITDKFSIPWNGSFRSIVPGAVGQGIIGLELRLSMNPGTEPLPIFSDGFESGNASSWTSQSP